MKPKVIQHLYSALHQYKQCEPAMIMDFLDGFLLEQGECSQDYSEAKYSDSGVRIDALLSRDFPEVFRFVKEYIIAYATTMFSVNQNEAKLSECMKLIVYTFVYLHKDISNYELIRNFPNFINSYLHEEGLNTKIASYYLKKHRYRQLFQVAIGNYLQEIDRKTMKAPSVRNIQQLFERLISRQCMILHVLLEHWADRRALFSPTEPEDIRGFLYLDAVIVELVSIDTKSSIGHSTRKGLLPKEVQPEIKKNLKALTKREGKMPAKCCQRAQESLPL